MAGDGTALHPGRELCRCAGHGGVPVPDRAFVIINLVVDLLYYAVDPRLRLDQYDDAYRAHPRLPPRTAEIRRDLHAHPELSFTEQRTSGVVAQYLHQLGVETHAGLAKTGVVGVIPGKKNGGRAIALRADMDCLPMHEQNSFSSQIKI